MHVHPLRLAPGDDLRGALEQTVRALGWEAGWVLQGIGSLSVAQLRYAGAPAPAELRGDLEILTLAGSLSPDGEHLNAALSDAQGRVHGGHVAPGCIVRTTAEILLASVPGHRFAREADAATGFLELAVYPAGGAAAK